MYSNNGKAMYMVRSTVINHKGPFKSPITPEYDEAPNSGNQTQVSLCKGGSEVGITN